MLRSCKNAAAPKAVNRRQRIQKQMRSGKRAASRIPTDRKSLDALTKQAADAARMLKLLGNKYRLLCLCFLLTRGEMTAGELVTAAGLSQSAMSQHLAMLREDGIVAYRREAQTLHYRVADPRAERILGLLKELYCGDVT